MVLVAIVPEHFTNFNEFMYTKPLMWVAVLFHLACTELRRREMEKKTKHHKPSNMSDLK